MTYKPKENLLYDSISKLRSQFNLKKLKIDKTLEKVAKEYAIILNKNKVLSHKLFKTTPLERVRKYNKSFYKVKEILAFGFKENEVIDAWNKSDNHKKALLSTDINLIGGYILKNKNNKNIFVVIFGEKINQD